MGIKIIVTHQATCNCNQRREINRCVGSGKAIWRPKIEKNVKSGAEMAGQRCVVLELRNRQTGGRADQLWERGDELQVLEEFSSIAEQEIEWTRNSKGANSDRQTYISDLRATDDENSGQSETHPQREGLRDWEAGNVMGFLHSSKDPATKREVPEITADPAQLQTEDRLQQEKAQVQLLETQRALTALLFKQAESQTCGAPIETRAVGVAHREEKRELWDEHHGAAAKE
ncbi:hypothetical protein FB451DRAFT_1172482 [Mycena latifolia]|nr:hypothetical protein FB451DRAFT_1172482 [Mycena latifolia]